MTKYPWEEVLNKLGIKYNNPSYYEQAFTHSSFSNEQSHKLHLERIEFMGDAVFQLFVSELIYKEKRFLSCNEGQLTLIRSKLVKEEGLAKIAKEYNLGKYVYLGVGEEKNHGRERVSLLADLVESLFGAIYLDQGVMETRKLVEKVFLPYIKELSLDELEDPKTRLQEYVQNDKRSLVYKVLDSTGPANNPTYTIGVYLDDEKIMLGFGKGRSKKEAEKEAAKNALSKLAPIKKGE
ncbi:MAG: ribonuclease III [Erysipelotrichaceae bacterium]|nr:ribonuclease III [Erysipelotrichaceae bacterium]